MIEPDIWAYNTVNSLTIKVIFWENDFEVFVDIEGKGTNYYEFEVNPLNTIWELSLDKPYNVGGIHQLISQPYYLLWLHD